MGPIKLKVSTNQPEYFAGSVVEGNVSVEVCTKDNKESSADVLKLRLTGVTKTTATYMVGSGDDRKRKTAHETQEFLSHDVQLADFGGKAASGVHTFPFSVSIPAGSPPSMQESGEGSCSIRYSFEAHLHRPGLVNFDAKDDCALTVLGTPQLAGPNVPVKAGPVTQQVKFCYCFNRGSMSIGFLMDHALAGVNECVGLNAVARNDSGSSVNQMEIELKQETTWTAKGHRNRKERTLASVVVPGSELGALQRAVEAGYERGQSVAVVEDNGRQDLERQLAAGAGTRYQLTVPSNSLFTFQAENVTVRHSVGVVLDTPCCIGAPAVWAPLCVHAGIRAGGAQSGAGSPISRGPMAPPSPQSVPYSSGPYGPTQPLPYPHPQEPMYVPVHTSPHLPPQTMPCSSGPYGPAQTAPYPSPQGTVPGSPMGNSYSPGGYAQYPIQQAVPIGSTVEMDSYGHAKPISAHQIGR